jgi:16S rRNA (guanine527-N7)-methyltransferase
MRDILVQGARDLGIDLTSEAAGAFDKYYDYLEDKNSVMDLTAITGKKEVATLHFLDSLAILTLDRSAPGNIHFAAKAVIDIGSGAGFPGVPMCIAENTIRLTLLDAQQKRVAFLEELREIVGHPDIRCIHARAEETALKPELRDSFDVAVSRAVARLNVLSELCLPFVKPGGVFIAMKSIDSESEIREAENAFKCLGARLEEIADYTIPGTEVMHRAAVIRKIAPTPSGYPRRFAKIQKSPL